MRSCIGLGIRRLMDLVSGLAAAARRSNLRAPRVYQSAANAPMSKCCQTACRPLRAPSEKWDMYGCGVHSSTSAEQLSSGCYHLIFWVNIMPDRAGRDAPLSPPPSMRRGKGSIAKS